MATKSSKVDQYANIAAIQVAESVADTIAFAKFAFPFSIMDKMALIISRIEYIFSSLTPLNSGGDYVIMGLAVSNSSGIDLTVPNDPQIVDTMRVDRYDLGTAATGTFRDSPVVKDFSSLPGGGLLVAPNPLYAAIDSNGANSVCGGWLRAYYTYLELTTDEYWQLVESRRIISN